MGRNSNRGDWSKAALIRFQETGIRPETFVSAFLAFVAETAADEDQFNEIMGFVNEVAVGFDNLIKSKAEEPETMPEEVVAALKLMGIDPSSVEAAFVPRPVAQVQAKDGKIKSGKYAGLDCECPSCLQLYGALFHNGTDGEA